MKKVFIITTLLVAAFFLGVALVQAKPDKDTDNNLPEVTGTYDVLGHPELKVKVFVHNQKLKPEQGASPALVCNLADPDSVTVVGSAGWHLPAGTWTYRLNTSSVPSSVGYGKLSIFAGLAFGTWQNTIPGKVTFVAGPTTTVTQAKYDRQNIITWGKAPGNALAITYTWYYPSTGLVAEVDTIMNQKFSWSWTPYNATNICADPNSYDAQDILTHELGHWMGLDDEYTSNYVNNTMYGYGFKGEVKADTLTAGDIAGINKIY